MNWKTRLVCNNIKQAWSTDVNLGNHFSLKILSHISVYQKRANNAKCGRITRQLNFKIFKKINSNSNGTDHLSTEILHDHSKGILVSLLYKLSKGNKTEFINTINNFFKICVKPLFLVGGLSSLDYSKCAPVTNFFNQCFQRNVVPLTDRLARVT